LRQEDAAVGYNPRYRGKRSYDPLLCIEANPSYLWDAELRPGNAGTWDGAVEVLDTCFANVPPDIRELRVRADAGFGFDPVFVAFGSPASTICRGRPFDDGTQAAAAGLVVSLRQPPLGDGGVRALPAWLAAYLLSSTYCIVSTKCERQW